jgi:hypothetical protein
MKTQKLAPSLLGVALISVALGCDKSSPPSAPRAPQATRSSPSFSGTSGGEQNFRWDIVSIDASGNISPGAMASALASDKSKITLTGSGTFGPGAEDDVTGGGTWQIFAPGASSASASGTYVATALVRFDVAPGTLSGLGLTDLIGNAADARAGLVILEIRYSDASRGILVVSCSLRGTPANVAEGVTASKGNVDFWNKGAQFTLFHVLHEEAD